MASSFRAFLVNDLFGDPALYVSLPWERRALLFDLGDITALSAGRLLKITDVFVSHAHVDHFVGFDHLLRVLLGRAKAFITKSCHAGFPMIVVPLVIKDRFYGVVFAGGWDGVLHALAAGDGHELWRFNTAQDFMTINGVTAKGGSLGAPGPVIVGGMVYVGSGYIGTGNGMPGNVLLAFSAE